MIFILMAASRLKALKPLVTSGIVVPEALRTTQLPNFCNIFLIKEKCSTSSIIRAPITISALPCRIGSISRGMFEPLYWLSPSVFTIISSPRLRQASKKVSGSEGGTSIVWQDAKHDDELH